MTVTRGRPRAPILVSTGTDRRGIASTGRVWHRSATTACCRSAEQPPHLAHDGLDVEVPVTLLRAGFAPPPRTLVDILRATVADHPDEPALDNGAQVLTYAEFGDAAAEVAAELAEVGVGRGDRVGVRVRSGTVDLYVAIMGVLVAGAAYVPVDADDPDERARTVFARGGRRRGHRRRPRDHRRAARAARPARRARPTPADDAWIIFTSGSTGAPKGVAVSHRSAAGVRRRRGPAVPAGASRSGPGTG